MYFKVLEYIWLNGRQKANSPHQNMVPKPPASQLDMKKPGTPPLSN